MEVVEKMAEFVCGECGSRRFKVLTEQVVSDVHNLDGKMVWGDVNTEQTVEKENVLEVVCANCGKILVESIQEKPISKEAWDNFWDSYLTDFITGFEHYAVSYEEDADELPHEHFLRGMAKGMWTIHKLIESLMVKDKAVGLGRKRVTLTQLGEIKVKRR